MKELLFKVEGLFEVRIKIDFPGEFLGQFTIIDTPKVNIITTDPELRLYIQQTLTRISNIVPGKEQFDFTEWQSNFSLSSKSHKGDTEAYLFTDKECIRLPLTNNLRSTEEQSGYIQIYNRSISELLSIAIISDTFIFGDGNEPPKGGGSGIMIVVLRPNELKKLAINPQTFGGYSLQLSYGPYNDPENYLVRSKTDIGESTFPGGQGAFVSKLPRGGKKTFLLGPIFGGDYFTENRFRLRQPIIDLDVDFIPPPTTTTTTDSGFPSITFVDMVDNGNGTSTYIINLSNGKGTNTIYAKYSVDSGVSYQYELLYTDSADGTNLNIGPHPNPVNGTPVIIGVSATRTDTSFGMETGNLPKYWS